jgi:thioesterase domain-containing protein
MTSPSNPLVFLPGAGNHEPDLGTLRSGPDDPTRFEVIYYPGWRTMVSGGFSADTLIDELARGIASKVPQGPIRIVGLSIGGHFGYAAALRLQASGRKIAGFCAIDSFMVTTEARTPGWKGRALAEAWELIRKRRPRAFLEMLRSKFWRAALRLEGGRLLPLMRRFASSTGSPAVSTIDPVLEGELFMRVLLRQTAPWLASLDRDPQILAAPAILLRTPRTSNDDAAWLRRCPNMNILEVPGGHHSLFDPENAGSLRQAFLAGTSGWN